MDLFNQRLNDVASYYRHGVFDWGFRRLIDSALDVGKTSILKDVIEFTEWKSSAAHTDDSENEKVQELIVKIKNAGITNSQNKIQNIITAKSVSKAYRKGNFTLGPLNVSVDSG